jgi:hypothetical protein
MKRITLCSIILFFLIGSQAIAQQGFKSEEELKEKAAALFEEGKLVEASPLFAQLLSLYPQDADYNFKYGACLLASDADKEKPLKYLSYALSRGNVDPLAYYYNARAYHLNYDFAKAVKYYSRFKSKASQEQRDKYQVDRKIEMCKNGNQLLSKLNEVQVLERQEIAEKDFYRIYKLDGIDGKLIAKPEEFQSKYDSKTDEKSIIFLPNNAKEVYYSSYGKKGETGRDIYKVVRLGTGTWSEPVKLGPSINTPYDEDYAFIHPDGRTLYFASKGHSSMGGYDLFKSTFDQTTASWTAPENLDFAFSSADDDIMFVTDKDQQIAYFASNRTNKAGEFTVYKVLVEKRPADLTVIKGKFIAENLPDLRKAKITVIDKLNNQTVGVYETDADGNYAVEIADNGGTYQFNIETTDDAPIHTGQVIIPKQDEFEVLGQELRLVGEGNAQQLVIKNIFDGTVAAANASSGPSVSAKVLRQKANLDVNFNAGQLAQLEKERKEEAQSETTSTTTAQNQPSQSNTGNGGAGKDVPLDKEGIAQNEEVPAGGNEASAAETSPANYSEEQQRLAGALAALKEELNQRLEEGERAENVSFNRAQKLKKQADQEFKQVEELGGASGTGENEQVKALQESAGEKALEAAFAAQLGQKLKESNSRNRELLQELNEQEQNLTESINKNQLSTVNTQVQEWQGTLGKEKKQDEVLAEEQQRTKEEQALSKQRQQSLGEKLLALSTEIEEKEQAINKQKELISTAGPTEKEDLEKQLNELEFDLKDLNYQKGNTAAKINELDNEKKALAVKSRALATMAGDIEGGTAQNIPDFSESEKENLVAALKEYREKNQLAYVNSSSKGLEETDNTNNTSDNLAANSKEVTAEKEGENNSSPNQSAAQGQQGVKDLEKKYASSIDEAESIADNDLSKARKIEVYDKWIEELEAEMVAKEALLSSTPEGSEKNNLKLEVDQLLQEIERRTKERDTQEEGLFLAEGQGISEPQSTTQNNEEQTIETNTSSTEELVEINEEVSLEPTVVSNVSEVDALTIVDDEFSNFKFDQSYSYGNVQNSEALTAAKKTLYEASLIAKEAEAARQSAYSLPTAEERKAAFEKANRLKAESEQKQLEAAGYFAEFNKNEFVLNQRRISNANNYEEEFESGNLDLANLLAEEAQVFFNNATEIRKQLDPNERLSAKEVELQKAYDYEMLALKKQRQALTKLRLVDDEVLRPATAVEERPFVQTISDANVLSIVNAEEAKEKRDSINTSISILQAEADQRKRQVEAESIGPVRDSLLLVYDTLQKQIEDQKNQAAVYYERERQINEGLADQVRVPEPEDVLVNPLKSIKEAEVFLDTVNVDAERKDLVLNSREFIQYNALLQERERLKKEAELEYNSAVAIAEEKQRLQKQAVVERNKASLETDATEKQRLIKSAEVIDLKVEDAQRKIDSANKVLKVKQYLVSSAEQRLENSISGLTAIEQNEIRKLASEYESSTPQSLAATTPKSVGGEGTTSAEEITSQETSVEQTEELAVLPQDNLSAQEGTGEDISPVEVATEERIPEEPKATQEESNTGELNRPEEVTEQVESSEKREEPAQAVASEKGNEVPEEQSATEEKPSESITPAQLDSRKEGPSKIVDTPSKVTKETRKKEEIPTQKKENKSTPIDNSSESRETQTASIKDINKVPRQIKQAIFVTLNGTESAYSVNNPIPVDQNLPEGLVFKVQIGAFRNPIPQNLFKGFAPISAEKTSSGITRYTAGYFVNEGTAITARDQIRAVGYPDAFVVAFLNGKRISIAEARGRQTGASEAVASAPKGANTIATGNEGANATAGTLSPAFSADDVEKVIGVQTIEGVYFTVQIGVFSKPVKKGTFKYENLNVIELSNGLIRYNAGIYRSLLDAADAKITIATDIADAFVTSYYKGKRISLNEAARLKNQ